MHLQSNNLNKVKALLYTIWKYLFKDYFEFGSVSPFWIWRENICARIDSIQSGINWQYIPTYMTNLNVYLNSCSLAVDFTLGCGTLVYLVLTAQPDVFYTHCGTEFVTPKNLGIYPVMPDPDPMAAIFPELVRTHKHRVCLLNEYHTVDLACKKIISKLILEKFYKSLSICIIGLAKVTSLEILTHLITEYNELEE